MPLFLLAWQTGMWQYCAQALFKALGLQQMVLKLTTNAYIFINLPLMILFTFHYKLGNIGIWLAILINTTFLSVNLYIMQINLDWNLAVK